MQGLLLSFTTGKTQKYPQITSLNLALIIIFETQTQGIVLITWLSRHPKPLEEFNKAAI